MFKIDRAQLDDAQELSELFVRYSRELERYEMAYDLVEESVLPTLQSRIKSKLALVAVARQEEKIVGFLLCNISRLSGYQYRNSILFGYIADTYVLPDMRNQGIAKALTDYSLSWLKENDVRYVELKVLESNAAAHRFWSENGFAPTTRTYGKEI